MLLIIFYFYKYKKRGSTLNLLMNAPTGSRTQITRTGILCAIHYTIGALLYYTNLFTIKLQQLFSICEEKNGNFTKFETKTAAKACNDAANAAIDQNFKID